jgi:hypothetical protein
MKVTLSEQAFPWDLRRRGLKDSIRHDARVREAVKKNLKELIAREEIITSDGRKKVRIPLQYLDQYRFKYGRPGEGTGQGEGVPGDVIGKDGKFKDGVEGEPGDMPGEEVYEAEFTLEEVTKMMLEDLDLPWLEEKDEKQQKTVSYAFDDVRTRGILPNLDKRKTLYQSLKRSAARGMRRVEKIVDDDLRFRVWKERERYQSNAAVYMLMDRSGSMTTDKKYIAKSFFFWLVRFLKLKYQNVDLVFITHDTQANLVEEKDFFAMSSSGGTMCSSAYLLALDHIVNNHPRDRWNNYVFHFSDGDNWSEDNRRCKEAVSELLNQTTMIGYGEIKYRDEATFYGWGNPYQPSWSTLHQEFGSIDHQRFITVAIKQKEDVYNALREFLGGKEEG